MTKNLNIKAIRIDGGTQSRVEINNQVVADYAEAIKAGIEFPPVVVFHDGTDHWLADGFHRFHAHNHAGKASISAEIHAGTVRDAILHSVGANGTHGLQRTNADKRKSVETLLQDVEWAKWSDKAIAKACAVSDKTVAAHRKAIFGISEDRTTPGGAAICNPITDAPTVRTVERAGKTYTQDTSKIGKSSNPQTAKAAAPEPSIKPEELAEAKEAVSILSEENDRLSDRLAVEAMDASEEEKRQAAETISDLRAKVKTLEAELAAVKVSRDTYMRECAQMKRQLAMQRKQLDKVAA